MGIVSAAKYLLGKFILLSDRFQSPMGIVSAAKLFRAGKNVAVNGVSIPDGDSFRREARCLSANDAAC